MPSTLLPRKSSGCLSGAAIDAEQRVNRTGLEEPGKERDQANPSPCGLRPEEHHGDQYQTEKDAKHPVYRSYIILEHPASPVDEVAMRLVAGQFIDLDQTGSRMPCCYFILACKDRRNRRSAGPLKPQQGEYDVQ